ncbi:hypothetical protein ACFQ0B_80720 [Nonomuraea thailandensis]
MNEDQLFRGKARILYDDLAGPHTPLRRTRYWPSSSSWRPIPYRRCKIGYGHRGAPGGCCSVQWRPR